MRLLKDIHKQILWFAIVLILLFSVLISLPLSFAFASDEFDDFEAFNSSLMEMIEEYDEKDEPVAVAFAVSEDENEAEENSQNNIKRLIVNLNGNVNSFGAVAKAEYKDLHIFQYKTAEEAESAFVQFSDSNIDVSYDAVTTINDVTIESTYTTNPWQNKTFQSWGAEYIGYKSYVETMLRGGQSLNQIVIAVLDSGINTSHVLFSDRIYHALAKDFTSEASTTSYAYEDLNGHGSHVSGIIADATLDNVKILPLKVLNSEGKGTVSMIVSALTYICELKEKGVAIPVLNMSIGIEARSGEIVRNTALENAIKKAYNSGIAPVVSAGNESMNVSYACPANVKEAITVSALLKTTSGQLLFDASYSNYGEYIDFSAPGTNIYSAARRSVNGYVQMSGTSMAAPHVAACYALLFSNPQYSNYGVDDATALLKENAVDLGTAGWDTLYGYGCVCMSEIGVRYHDGKIVFSETAEFHTSEFNLTLSYTDVQGSVEIYYTTNEYANSVDDSTGTLFSPSSPIKISNTTKVIAVAYITTADGVLQSYVFSQTYYFNNIDVWSNFEVTLLSTNTYELTKYNGKLTSLNVQATYKNGRVASIGKNAFNGSNVQTLILPSTLSTIDAYAFENNLTLESISCAGNIQVNTYAFYGCRNLKTVDMPKTASVGTYSFAYCTSLKELQIFYATSVGKHAISGSAIESLYVGKNIVSIGEHSLLSLQQIYGYAAQDQQSVAEQFAYDYNVNFVDMTLTFTKNLPTKYVVLENEPFALDVEVAGLNVRAYSSGSWFTGTSVGDAFGRTLSMRCSGLTAGTYRVYLTAYDEFYSVLQSNVMEIVSVADASQVFSLNVNGDCNAFVDENLLAGSSLFLKNSSHNVKIVPQDGFILESVFVNGQQVDETEINRLSYEFVVNEGSGNLEIEVNVAPKTTLEVAFDITGQAQILVGQNAVQKQEIDRDEDLTFEIVPKQGYVVKRVTLNNLILLADGNGKYTIRNISSDLNVRVILIEQQNEVKVVCGNGGTVSTTGSVEGGVLPYGASRIYTISTSQGYVVDFVSVNGERIELVNNSFEVKNNSATQDDVISVVISFKKADGNIFSTNSVLMTYFFIFVALFAMFVVAKIVLYVIRKVRKSKEQNNI